MAISANYSDFSKLAPWCRQRAKFLRTRYRIRRLQGWPILQDLVWVSQKVLILLILDKLYDMRRPLKDVRVEKITRSWIGSSIIVFPPDFECPRPRRSCWKSNIFYFERFSIPPLHQTLVFSFTYNFHIKFEARSFLRGLTCAQRRTLTISNLNISILPRDPKCSKFFSG